MASRKTMALNALKAELAELMRRLESTPRSPEYFEILKSVGLLRNRLLKYELDGRT